VTIAHVLLLLAMTCRWEPRAQLEPIAAAIAHAATTEQEAALLVAISHNETTCGRSGVPFGACAYVCRAHCGNCRSIALDVIADHALSVLRRGIRECGSVRSGLQYYRTGACGEPSARAYATRIAIEADRLMRR
jgi:hypothetical protein